MVVFLVNRSKCSAYLGRCLKNFATKKKKKKNNNNKNSHLAVDKGEHVRPKTQNTHPTRRRLLEILGRACSIFRWRIFYARALLLYAVCSTFQDPKQLLCRQPAIHPLFTCHPISHSPVPGIMPFCMASGGGGAGKSECFSYFECCFYVPNRELS